MLAGLQALKRLRGVHLRRRRENDRVEARKLQGLGEIGRDMANPIFRRRLLRLVEFAPNERDRLDPVDRLIASRCLRPKAPAPASATLSVLVMTLPGFLVDTPSSDLRLKRLHFDLFGARPNQRKVKAPRMGRVLHARRHFLAASVSPQP